jgi:glyoxylase-like metal-dependent hydrolase (beta-lactamase superfamily II)
MALVTCPTSSIGTVNHLDASRATAAFPERLEGDVLFCGFASESSFGARSYLLRRAQGALLVDSPRAAGPLLKAVESTGGVTSLFLTHRDDVADHQKLHARFGCDRIIHERDAVGALAHAERIVTGDDPLPLANDLLVIPVPGHTAGSMALLFQERYLFTGDHLWWEPTRGSLWASRSVCWHSWAEQKRSLARLLDYRFEWVLPGHGWPYRAESAAHMRNSLQTLLAELR